MLFSILIANYNNGHFLKDCLDSILNQTYQNFEVIIVDDASTDDSLAIIEEMIKNDSRFKLFKNEKNSGCGYTKSKCVELATGDLCGFVDPDDAIVSNALMMMVDAFSLNSNASLISSKHYYTDINLNVIGNASHGEKIPKNYSYLTFGMGAITHFATFKRDAYNKSKGINPKFKRAVDQDLYYRIEEQGEIDFLDEFLYYYRINENSISSNHNIYKAKYWHYISMKDAYLRRIKQPHSNVFNFTRKEFKKMQSDYYISRIKREMSYKNYCKKYFFLIISIYYSPNIDWNYKLLCLRKPNYY